MLQNPCKTLGFKKNIVYKIPPGGGGGKPYPASGLISESALTSFFAFFNIKKNPAKHGAAVTLLTVQGACWHGICL